MVSCFFRSALRPWIPFVKLGSASKKWGYDTAVGISENRRKSLLLLYVIKLSVAYKLS